MPTRFDTHARLIICKVRLWCPAWRALSEMRHRYPKCDTDVCLTSSGAGVSGNAQALERHFQEFLGLSPTTITTLRDRLVKIGRTDEIVGKRLIRRLRSATNGRSRAAIWEIQVQMNNADTPTPPSPAGQGGNNNKLGDLTMRRRTFLAASAATLALPAIGQAESQRVLKFIPQSDLAILDPVWTTAYVTRNHAYMIYDTLYGQTGQRTASRPRLRCWPATRSKTTTRPGS